MSDLIPASPPPPPQASRRFWTGAFVVSVVAHIIFFAVGSQLPATVLPPPDRLIEVTFVPATPKKLVLAAVPRPRPPRRQPPPKPRRVVPPKVIRVVRRVMPPVPKPLPAAKPVTPPKLRIAQAPVPNKPVSLVKPLPITRPQTPTHDQLPLKAVSPPLKNVNHSHAAPPAPGLHTKSPRRLAQRWPDEASYPTHPFEGDTTHNPTLPPTNTNATRHQDLDLATGSDAVTGPTRNSSRATHLRHSGITGGNHADTQPFLPAPPPHAGGATDNGAPSRTNSTAPGETENGSAQEHDSNAGSPDTGSTDDSGFNHSGLPSSQSEGDNGTRPSSSRTHGNDDAAGTTEDAQPSGRSGHHGGSRHHQRLADNPFGDLPPSDRPAPEIKPTPTQPAPQKLPAHRLTYTRADYPAEAVRLNEQGTTRLRVTISASGDVEKVEIKQSSGYDDLDESAQQWAHTLKFEPAQRNGIAVLSTQIIASYFHTHLPGETAKQ